MLDFGWTGLGETTLCHVSAQPKSSIGSHWIVNVGIYILPGVAAQLLLFETKVRGQHEWIYWVNWVAISVASGWKGRTLIIIIRTWRAESLSEALSISSKASRL